MTQTFAVLIEPNPPSWSRPNSSAPALVTALHSASASSDLSRPNSAGGQLTAPDLSPSRHRPPARPPLGRSAALCPARRSRSGTAGPYFWPPGWRVARATADARRLPRRARRLCVPAARSVTGRGGGVITMRSSGGRFKAAPSCELRYRSS